MKAEDYGATKRTLDTFLDHDRNEQRVKSLAQHIDVFHWMAPGLNFVAIPIQAEIADIVAATSSLTKYYDPCSLKVGETYCSPEEIAELMVASWTNGSNEAGWSAERSSPSGNQKGLRVYFSKRMGFTYNGRFVEAPNGYVFMQVRDVVKVREPVESVLKTHEALYIHGLADNQASLQELSAPFN